MSPLLLSFALVFTLSWLSHRVLVRSGISSSLFRLPVPHWSCHFSSIWINRACATRGELETLYVTHQGLGPVVRLAPSEVSVVSEEGLRKIYTAGLDKSDWYERTFQVYDVPNLVCTLNHATHSTIRKMIAGLYTKSHLQHSADFRSLSEKIIFERLLPKIAKNHQKDERTEVMELFECVAVDFITSYIFGSDLGTDFLGGQVGRDAYFEEWRKIRSGATEKTVTEALYLEKCKAAVLPRYKGKASRVHEASVAAKLYDGMSDNAQRLGLTEDAIVTRCASEMVDHVIATQETVAITWTYILYRLSQHPTLQNKLHTELLALKPTFIHSDINETLPGPADIDKLPLLNAVVMETLRLHAANPARMRRVVPSTGLSLHGRFIQPGTVVSTNAYCLHRNPDVFPEPFEWLPERWLVAEGGDLDAPSAHAMRKWFWAFGSGPRGCIGQHLALQIMKLVVAAIYSQFTTAIVDDDGIEQSDSYNSGPISHRLVLRFVPRQGVVRSAQNIDV